jgi:hypothetical protein
MVGTTFAWFTDSIFSSGNRIITGTIKIAAEWSDATPNGYAYNENDLGEDIFGIEDTNDLFVFHDTWGKVWPGVQWTLAVDNPIWSNDPILGTQNPAYWPIMRTAPDLTEYKHLPLLNGLEAANTTWYNPEGWSKLNDGAMIMDELFEPNKSGAKYIRAWNDGSTLPADIFFELSFHTVNMVQDTDTLEWVYETNPDGTIRYSDADDIAKLSEVLKVKLTQVDAAPDTEIYDNQAFPVAYGLPGRPTLDDWKTIPTLSTFLKDFVDDPPSYVVDVVDGKIKIDSRMVRPHGVGVNDGLAFRIDYMMCPWAGNEYQNKAIIATVGIVAVQHNTYGYNFNPYGTPSADLIDDYGTHNEIFLIGDLYDLEKALIALAKNPGMTWIFTNDVTVTMDWAMAHDDDWRDTVSAAGYAVYVDISADIGNVPGTDVLATLYMNYPVNIDLGGYTWDLSIFKNAGIFDDGSMGSGGIHFTNNTEELPCAVEIANGTLIADCISYVLMYPDATALPAAINLPASLKTDAIVVLKDDDLGEFVSYTNFPWAHVNCQPNPATLKAIADAIDAVVTALGGIPNTFTVDLNDWTLTLSDIDADIIAAVEANIADVILDSLGLDLSLLTISSTAVVNANWLSSISPQVRARVTFNINGTEIIKYPIYVNLTD